MQVITNIIILEILIIFKSYHKMKYTTNIVISMKHNLYKLLLNNKKKTKLN